MRPVIRAAIRHTHCLFAYCFSLPTCFSSNTTRRPFVYPLFMPVSFLVSSYLVSKGVSFLYRLVHTCRIRYTAPSGLAHRVLFAPRLIARRRTQHRYRNILIISYIHRILVSLYPCIFYIHRIHHIYYIHPSTRHDEPYADIQASSRRAASLLVRLQSNGRHEARAMPPRIRNRRRRAK